MTKPGKFTACKGVKNVYEFDRGHAKVYITVVLTFPASGVLCSLMLIYSCKRIAYITKRIPNDMVGGTVLLDG
jgi:hypothetical protein